MEKILFRHFVCKSALRVYRQDEISAIQKSLFLIMVFYCGFNTIQESFHHLHLSINFNEYVGVLRTISQTHQ